MSGAFISGRVAGKWSAAKTVRAGYMIMLLAVGFNVMYSALTPPALPWAVIPIYLYAMGTATALVVGSGE